MPRLRNIIFNICFAVDCLLLFLLIFESRLALPSWVQVMGRTHVMILHFPVVLIVLCIFWFLFIEKKDRSNETIKQAGDWLLLLSAFTTSITALMGLFLSKEEGYDLEALMWHKWSGASMAILVSVWYAYRNAIKRHNWLNAAVACTSLAVIVFTGHQGAGITHGQNYLFAPMLPEKKQPQVLMENAEVYAHMVVPILQAKCMSCHNAKKAKGELVMQPAALLLKGGKNGKLWDSTAAGYGLLLSRIHLPVEAKKHMPPQGKPQLTEQEMEILYQWIKSGASFKTKVIELPETDTLRIIAASLFNTIETDDYVFAAADEKKLKALNNNYRVITPLSIGSPALDASFFSAQAYKPEQLKELLAVKEQLVSLDLNKMPVKDAELKTIGQFKNLKKLNLSFSAITGVGLAELTTLHELRQLSLSGTAVKKEDLLKLAPLKKLSQLFIWNTNLSDADIDIVRNKLKATTVEKGFKGDTSILKLTPPILVNEEQVIVTPIELKLKHYINGVTIRYTLDGTDPDSLRSPEYHSNIMLDKNVTLKARAYKQGWISSDSIEAIFYSSKYKVDSAIHIQPADPEYAGDGAKTLIDLVKGEKGNLRSGKWLGFRKNKMETLLLFTEPKNVSSVTLSSLIDIAGYIMPPVSVEVWGGNDSSQLKLLSRMVPQQPVKVERSKIKPAYLRAFELPFAPATVKYLKIIAVPVPKLPSWHPGKGEKGWIFVDEVFVN